METMFTEKRALTMARDIRVNILRAIGSVGFGHVGGSMSMADLLGVLYGGAMKIDPKNPKWEERDYFVCSKGHTGPAVYGALAASGYFPEDWLMTLNRLGTNLPSHCDRIRTPGIDMTAGSLGQGLSAAAGIALATKMNGGDNYCYCLIGDGESQEGQNWEAMMFAGHNKLDNLILFVDNNKEQLDGYLSEVNQIDNYGKRIEQFYWHAQDVDGHNVAAINEAIDKAKAVKDRPSVIVLDTIKGQGSFAVGQFNHSMNVTKEQIDGDIQKLQALTFA